jgi:hypothetical protein
MAGKAGAVHVLGALAAAAALAPLPALAQAVESSPARITVLDPATAGVLADMHFGQITTTGTAGTVVMTPSASPTCTTTGGLVRAGICRAALFEGTATYQAEVRVMRPSGNSIQLTGPGGATMQVDTFVFAPTGSTSLISVNGANTRLRVNATDGSYAFYAGATLRVAATQAPGTYTGTFEIRITFQ